MVSVVVLPATPFTVPVVYGIVITTGDQDAASADPAAAPATAGFNALQVAVDKATAVPQL